MSNVLIDNEQEQVKQHPSMLGIVWSPIEQFERIKEKPKVLVPMIILTLIWGIAGAMLSFGMDIKWLLASIPPEQHAEFAQMESFLRISSFIGYLITPIVVILIVSAIMLLISKATTSEVTFKQLFSMNVFISFIGALSLLVNGGLAILLDVDPMIPITSVGNMMQAEGVAGAILNQVELFAVWGVILTALGLIKVANFHRVLAWSVSIIFTLVTVGFAVIGALLGGM
ncbi:YIP1 family protein [Bacillus alkalicellulosilyticus]|uniref:YIP1 family protein n=1 Tax=Alkalihalobacterium alkalicellulosilyticum TaxID=1912214 RepID=UPI00148330C9|nr:YIP1 family protein [Bacillus alkalicellulosilyticus]